MFEFIKNWFKKEPSIKGQSIDEIEEEEILKNQDEYFVDLLKFYARQDKEKYFQARDERAILIIRGEYLRTLFLIKKIEKLKTLKVGESKEENLKISGRYAT